MIKASASPPHLVFTDWRWVAAMRRGMARLSLLNIMQARWSWAGGALTYRSDIIVLDSFASVYIMRKNIPYTLQLFPIRP